MSVGTEEAQQCDVAEIANGDLQWHPPSKVRPPHACTLPN